VPETASSALQNPNGGQDLTEEMPPAEDSNQVGNQEITTVIHSFPLL